MTGPLPNSPLAFLAGQAAQEHMRQHQLAFAQLAPDLRLRRVSPNFAEFTTGEPGPLEGLPVSECLFELVGSEQFLQAILRGEEARLTLERINRDQPDGTVRYLTLQVTPLSALEPGLGLLLIVEDTTATTQLELRLLHQHNELRLAYGHLESAHAELERLSQLKSFLLAMLAHDLRSPLTAIQLHAGQLRQSLGAASSGGQQGALAGIRLQVNRLDRLIANVLDLDRIERGQLQPHRQPCDLGRLVQDLLAADYPAPALRNRTLQVEAPDPPLIVSADADLLRQVVHNLVDNAVKYTPENGRIAVRLRREDAQAVLEVTDNGPGLSEAQQASLFQPYTRADLARWSGTPGYGLGLFIVKTLVEAHQGQVRVYSQAGGGSTFQVLLPDPGPAYIQ